MSRASVRRERLGLLFGLVGAAVFSLFLPATRGAAQELAPEIVGLARPGDSGGTPSPDRRRHRRLRAAALVVRAAGRVAVRAAGVAFGFPLLPALAMRRVDSLHGGVVFAVLPLLTAAAMAALAGERPSGRFWL